VLSTKFTSSVGKRHAFSLHNYTKDYYQMPEEVKPGEKIYSTIKKLFLIFS
jgi:hypothetical protein